MKYSGEFKCIDTHEKAYFLGQAFGDGYNSSIAPYKFSMASINTDIAVYKTLQKLFPFLKLRTYQSHSNMIYLECYEKAFCIDLANLGLVSNKAKKDETKEFHFPDLESQYLSDFIRGYFDADGSAWYPTRYRSRNNLHIEFGCATPNFLSKLKEILNNKGINFTYTSRFKKAGNGKYYMSYVLFSSSSSISEKFADFIYQNSSLYLQYKYDKCYRTKIDMPPSNYEVYGVCPYCQSTSIRKSGTRNMKHGLMQRLKCVSCSKGFSVPMPM